MWFLYWTVLLASGETVTAWGGWYDTPKQCLWQAARVTRLEMQNELVELRCAYVDLNHR